MAIVYEAVREVEIMHDIVALQKLVWGADSITSMPQMVAAIHHGGVVIAAFDDGKVVGFCYGFPGWDGGKAYLFSHMMAIHPDYRDAGLGKSLKERQRIWAIEFGYDKIAWTYDPLETRNGFLNLNKLGGYVRKYLPSYYGIMNDPVNGSLPTDRFLVEWELRSPRCENAIKGDAADRGHWSAYPRLFEWEFAGSFPRPRPAALQAASDAYLVPVPASFRDIRQHDMELARSWRLELREHLTKAFADRYRVVGMWRTEQPVHYYVLEKSLSS